ncbi:MAG: hypothetical protein JWM76_387 [Pseudonocardiales bacterium]|nr:hypothetical protein [Pseudonocardiales bacterium]
MVSSGVTAGVPADARRVAVAPERLNRWLDNFAARHGALEWERGPERVAVVAADGSRAWFEVPYPPLIKQLGVATDLITHASADRRIGAILVRRGGYGAGVFEGSRLIASKVDTSYVQGTTKAGGWSQQRYARRRANQAHSAFAEAADIAARILVPALATLDAVVTGGDRAAVDEVLADPRLSGVRELVRGPLLQVPDPRLRVLQQLPEQFRAVTVRIHP